MDPEELNEKEESGNKLMARNNLSGI
jgi:hypothetical protein